MKLKEAWNEHSCEILHLIGSWICIAIIFSFVIWAHDAKGFLEIISIIAAIVGALLTIATIMGTMVTVSDFSEDLFKKDDY